MKKRLLPFTLFLILSVSLLGQWTPQAAGTLPANYHVMNVSIVSDMVAWGVALDYEQWISPVPPTHVLKIFRTTNGGATWTVEDFSQAPGRVTLGIVALDENTALLNTSNFSNTNELFKTTDGGDTWDLVDNGAAAGGRVMFFNAQEGVSVDINAAAIARTDNGGESWTLLTPNTDYPSFLSGENHLNTPTNWDIVGDTVWIGTTRGRLYKSTDRGQSWTVHQATAFNNRFVSTAFIDSKSGLALVGDFNNPPLKLLRTMNGGVNWDEISNKDNLSEVFAIPSTNAILGVSWYDNLTTWSQNLGNSWVTLNSTLKVFAPVFSSKEVGWITNGDVTGPNPAIYKWDESIFDGHTYVNQNAIGNNDGTSWSDAYTDLQDALTNAEEGDEIWVAKGTYLPGTTDTATFLINKDLQLYGGFAGTEYFLSERDIEQNPTILSGDPKGNDVDGDFQNFKSDNVLTVVTIDDNITAATIIDGFTVRGGHADEQNGPSNVYFRGGGLYSMGSQIIRNCVFEHNYAYWVGGGVQLQRNSGIITVQVENCTFRSNWSTRGAGLNIHNTNCIVRDCVFEDNVAPEHGGGMRYAGNRANRTIEIYDCHFSNNSAAFGGGLRISSTQNSNNFHIEGCEFFNNRTEQYQGWGQGGAGTQIAIFDETGEIFFNSVTIKNCSYDENQTGLASNDNAFSSGGGIQILTLNATNTLILMDSCSLSNNEALSNGSAGYIELGGLNGNLQIQNCSFDSNTTHEYSAALDLWGTEQASGSAVIENCHFNQNSSHWSGALEMGNGWNGGAEIEFEVKNSTFTNNEANEGGAIGLWNEGESPTNITLENCLIENNSATSKGGAISITPRTDNFSVNIHQSQLVNNTSPMGGAIYANFNDNTASLPDNYFVQIENSLIAGGSNNEAAIRVDSVSNLSLLNCTVADYSGGAIHLADQSRLTLQNNILSSPELPTIADMTSDGIILSKGGNLLTDPALGSNAHTSDQEETDPMFVGSGDPCTYYGLNENSPAIGKGIDEVNESAVDLCGNNRVVGCIDIGAYEHPDDNSTACLIVDTKEILLQELRVFPNPANTYLQMDFPEHLTQSLNISIEAIDGKTLNTQIIPFGQPINVSHLPAGVYLLRATTRDKIYYGKFIKQ